MLRIAYPGLGMLQISKYCLQNIWPESQSCLLGPILHFMQDPTQQTLEESNQKLKHKTGKDMIYWSIKYGYPQVIQSILVIENVTLQTIKDAITEGEIRIIKIVLIEAKNKGCINDLEQTRILTKMMKMLSSFRGGELTIFERQQLLATLLDCKESTLSIIKGEGKSSRLRSN